MSSNWIVVDAEIAKVQKALTETSKSFTSIQKQALGILARNTVAKIKPFIALSLKHPEKSTKELQNAYGFRVKKDGSEANIYPKGKSGSKIFPKAFIQNYGYNDVTARSKSNGKKWHITPKAFIQYGENLLSSNAFDSKLSEMVDKNLKKYWGK